MSLQAPDVGIVRTDDDALADHPADVHANVAVDLNDYIRSNTIRNEQQFQLLSYSVGTAFLADPDNFNSVIVIGTSSSGKTHVMERLKRLLEHVPFYETTSGSAKSMIYDEAWGNNVMAFLNEMQKHDDETVEFLKSAHGGDAGFVYKSTRGSVRDGFETETIEKKAMPYFFTFAQWAADFELWNRLLKIPIHESESKNRAVGSMAFGHQEIEIGDDTATYVYDYDSAPLKGHFRLVYDDGPYNVWIPSGDLYDWDVWEIIKPIFNHGRSEANRIYQMVSNLIMGSTALNVHTRRSLVDEDGTEYLIATPQDVANVLSARRALLATTHEIDRKKRAIVEGIKHEGGKSREVVGTEPIVDFLAESDAPQVKESELENILEDLAENFIISIDENAADGNRNIYRYEGWDELGFARVQEHKDVFRGTVNPITGKDFVESHRDFKENLETDAQDMLKKVNVTSEATGGSDDGESSLGDFGGGFDDGPDVELTDLEQFVHGFCESLLDGERIRNLTDVPVEVFVGVVEPGEDRTVADVEGTPLDPDHEVWDDPELSDDWEAIQSREDARRELKQAAHALIDKGMIEFEEVHETDDAGNPLDVTLSVNSHD